ncbi:HECT-domain-containing protein [Meredithblackwellia eburnea MCA 4105]
MEEDVSHLARRRQIVTRTTPALSKRQLAFISPRLGVLNNIPFVIPFATRVAIFRQFIENDRRRMHLTYEDQMYSRSRHHRATIRRGHVSEDSFASLNGLGGALKGTIQIIFKDQHGIEETGIDGGGLFKELLTELSKEAFDTDRGLWLETAQHELYPNPHAYARESAQLAWYTFMGRILGKALYEGILIEARFSGFFLAKWLGRQSYLDDLADLDPELYNGLIFLKNYTGNVEQDLSLNFTINDEEFGVSRTIELVPGGSDIAVTNENRIRYIYLTSHYRLNGQMALQCAAFFSGLSEIIPERFLRMFNQEELRMLVGGVDRPIDIEDLKANTVYGGWDGDEANDTIRNFWSVVERFDKDDRSKLVKFVTSCARPPLLGFKELNPRFAIRRAGDDQSRLPTSSTCVNLLKLPDFKDKDLLEEKLRLSINAGAGFDLS